MAREGHHGLIAGGVKDNVHAVRKGPRRELVNSPAGPDRDPAMNTPDSMPAVAITLPTGDPERAAVITGLRPAMTATGRVLAARVQHGLATSRAPPRSRVALPSHRNTPSLGDAIIDRPGEWIPLVGHVSMILAPHDKCLACGRDGPAGINPNSPLVLIHRPVCEACAPAHPRAACIACEHGWMDALARGTRDTLHTCDIARLRTRVNDTPCPVLASPADPRELVPRCAADHALLFTIHHDSKVVSWLACKASEVPVLAPFLGGILTLVVGSGETILDMPQALGIVARVKAIIDKTRANRNVSLVAAHEVSFDQALADAGAAFKLPAGTSGVVAVLAGYLARSLDGHDNAPRVGSRCVPASQPPLPHAGKALLAMVPRLHDVASLTRGAIELASQRVAPGARVIDVITPHGDPSRGLVALHARLGGPLGRIPLNGEPARIDGELACHHGRVGFVMPGPAHDDENGNGGASIDAIDLLALAGKACVLDPATTRAEHDGAGEAGAWEGA